MPRSLGWRAKMWVIPPGPTVLDASWPDWADPVGRANEVPTHLHFHRGQMAGGLVAGARSFDPMRAVDRWRFRCPNGHTAWEMNRLTFWCSECYERIDGQSGQFDRVLDLKTQDRLTAEELRRRLTGL